MTVVLEHSISPLEQVRRNRRIELSLSAAGLSERDQAILRQILESPCDYVPNRLFSSPKAYQKIFEQAPEIPRPDISWYHPVIDNPSELPPAATAGPVLLTAHQEKALFLQFNYCRHMVAKLKEKAGSEPLTPALARQILDWHRQAEALRDQIAQTNLALVLAMAKRTRISDVEFSELVSEGNMALLRAIDKFDVARGFKFSTYACRAILKAFSRLGVKLTRYRQLFPADFDPKLERSNFLQIRRAGHEDDCVDEIRRIICENRAELTPIERQVIEHRFALGRRKQENPEAQPLTLEQVGKIIGVTKERVRQIQNKALEKIRQSLENNFLS